MKKEDLPNKIPVFPLSNFIIFPRTTVPLNIFEPRYIEMINDSMKTNKLIGLIQPKKNKISSSQDLYEVGCLGKITNFEETSDGRYFTGRNPNDPPNQEIQIQEDSKLTDAEEGEIGSYNLSTSLYLVPEVYATAKSLNPNSTPPLPPTQVINLPTKENYKWGEFQRYFSSKNNEVRYTEIDENQYTKFVDKDPQGKKFGWVIFNTKTNELIAKHDDKKTIEKMKQRYERMGEPVTMMTFSKAFQYNEEVKLDEAIKISHVLIDTADRNEVVSMASSEAQIKQSKNSAERPPMSIKDKNTLKIVKLKRPLGMKAADKLFGYPFKESAELDEAKSSTGYELYHKSFSDAMQHSYAFAKKKFGITVDPKEIDRKVATGPKKPSSGKTNSYRLVGTDGKKAIQVQVANLDNKRYELNMYKEEVDLEEGTEFDTMKAYASGISRILGSQGIEVPINELIDPADIDDDASSKDVALAAKNIILQLKKSVDMNGKKDVEFASGKQKVPAAIAQKALDVHSKMKPQDKMKFQTTIAKSYTGLLNAIKGK